MAEPRRQKRNSRAAKAAWFSPHLRSKENPVANPNRSDTAVEPTDPFQPDAEPGYEPAAAASPPLATTSNDLPPRSEASIPLDVLNAAYRADEAERGDAIERATELAQTAIENALRRGAR